MARISVTRFTTKTPVGPPASTPAPPVLSPAPGDSGRTRLGSDFGSRRFALIGGGGAGSVHHRNGINARSDRGVDLHHAPRPVTQFARQVVDATLGPEEVV